MAKKPNKPVQGTPRPQPQATQQKKAAPAKPAVKADAPSSERMVNVLTGAAIVLITFLFLMPCLQNLFTNWDDPGYVENNPLIKDLSGEGLRAIFSTPVMGNYHPLTILSYAIDYHFAELKPEQFHLQSLLFHLATTLLVYWFVLLLTKRWMVAVITGLLFGIHPMHVESIAWIAGRKDVIYGFFYMAACITWLFYSRDKTSGRWKWYAVTMLLFVCALLGKPVAVVLSLTLLVIDMFTGYLFSQGDPFCERIVANAQKARLSINPMAIIDKILPLVISIGFGIRSIQDQSTFKALGTQSVKYNVFERIELGAYALITYLWKAIVPAKLACFYPYPMNDYTHPENAHLPFLFIIYPLIVIGLLVAIWMYFRRSRAMWFGVLFFLVNIVLLLQFIPVGGAIIADRYSYIAYIGLFFLLGWGISALLEKKETLQMGRAAMVGVAVYCMVLGYMAGERCKDWRDPMSLWRSEIEVEPVRAPNAYNNLGFSYYTKFNEGGSPAERKLYYDSANYLLRMAFALQPKFVNPYVSLGELFRSAGQYDSAKKYYYTALTMSDSEQVANAYLGLSVIYSIAYNQDQQTRDLAKLKFDGDSALYCYNRCFGFKTYFPEAHSNYANFLDMSGNKEAAIKEYGVAIKQNPDKFQPYLNRGRAYQRSKLYKEALADFNKAVELYPNVGELYYVRAQFFAETGDNARARQDMDKAQSLGYTQSGGH